MNAPEKQKIYDPYLIMMKMQSWCAYQERSQYEVRKKLYEFSISSDDIENIIVKLIEDNFINEERFAMAFAHGKFSIKKWGRIKIKQELKQKHVSDYCIKKALQQIDSDVYLKNLRGIIEAKARLLKERDTIKLKYKLINYALSKGYEQDLIRDVLSDYLQDVSNNKL